MPPTNIDAASATVISALPYDITVDVSGLSSPYEVWWKYTGAADDIMIGMVAYAQSGSTYRPQITLWTGTPASLTAYLPSELTIGHDTPAQVPVDVGVDYYIKIKNDSFGSTGGTLVFSIDATPSEDIPVGSILVNDDTEFFFASILDASTGAVIAQARLTQGEEGAVTDNGILALQNDDALSESPKVYLYDGDFNLITTITFTDGEITLNSNIDLIYTSERISPSANSTIRTYDESGILQNTYALNSNRPIAIAAKKDNSILYFHRGNTGEAVRQLNLSTLVVSTFSPVVANHTVDKQGLQVLSDDTLLVAWKKDTSVEDYVIKGYNTSGSEIYSFAFTPPANRSDGPRIAIADDDPNSFWVWASGVVAGNRQSKFQRIKVSDGSTLASFTVNVFESGLGPAEAGNVDPTQRFGNSKSCPMLVLRTSTTSPTSTYGGLYVLVPDKTEDTLYTGDTTTLDVKIPNPMAQLYLNSDGS